MARLRWSLCLLLLALVWFPSAAGAEAPLSLGELESRALEVHPVLKALRASVRDKEAALEQARAGLAPKLDLVLYGSKAKEPPKARVYDPLGGPVGYAVTGYEETYRAALALTQVLYSGGTLTYQVRAAEAAMEAARAEEERGREGVLFQLRSALYGVLRAKGRVQVASRVVELSERYLERVKAFYSVGMVPRAELLRAQVALSNAKVNLIRANGAVERAYAMLDRACGFVVPRDRELVVEAGDLAIPQGVDVQGIALRSRRELRSLDMYRRQALALAGAADGQGRPQLLFKGEAYRVGPDFFPSEEEDYLLSLTLQWRMLDFGEVRARADQARAQAEALLGRFGDMELQIRQEAVDAFERLKEARERLAAADVGLKQAEEDHRIAERRYDARVGTNLDVLDARVRLEQAMNDLVDARYDLLSAQAALRYALGEEGWGMVLRN